MNYQEFIVSKQRTIEPAGFEPGELPIPYWTTVTTP